MWPFDQNNQGMYQQYSQAYDTGTYNGFNHNQVLEHLLGFMQGAPYDMQQQVYQQHFSQMPYEQRALLAQQMPPQYYADPNDPFSLSQNFLRLGQEQPHLIRQIFSHPMLLAAAVGLAGLAAKHMMSHHQVPYGGQQYTYNQGYNQGGFPNQGYNQGGFQQNPYQQEIRREQEEINELREELSEEERERRRHHHHHRESW